MWDPILRAARDLQMWTFEKFCREGYHVASLNGNGIILKGSVGGGTFQDLANLSQRLQMSSEGILWTRSDEVKYSTSRDVFNQLFAMLIR